MTRVISFAVLACLSSSAFALGQTPAAPVPPSPVPQGAQPTAPALSQEPQAKPSPLEPQGFTYEAEGRRDPFISLVRTGGSSDPTGTSAGPRPAGLPGIATDEVALRGTIKGRDGSWVAILVGVDKKSYLARAGDRLFDGAVRSVTENEMVILQRVNDPLTLATQREVRKVLRQTEEAN